uniref:Immunoglobulin superfamily member 10 n=1 Tax=Junco hyemalis TaxID=40217 RepID=A0A8C5IAT4_JUNHY
MSTAATLAASTCTAANALGSARLRATLAVLALPPRIAAARPPTALSGGSAALPCRARGSPPPRISWLLPDGSELRPGAAGRGRAAVQPDGTLLLRALTVFDRGTYTCRARNAAGSDVAQRPRILSQPAGLVRGVSGEPLALHCPAEGSPRPRVAWTLPGGRVLQRPQLRGRLLLLDNGTLLIGAASPLDTGTYLCRAHNDAGDSSLSVPVVVAAYTPRITGRPPPAIHTTPGAAIQLHCIVLGVPKPEITWELPDGSVLSTAHQNPQPSGSGTYRCTARNPLGTHSPSPNRRESISDTRAGCTAGQVSVGGFSKLVPFEWDLGLNQRVWCQHGMTRKHFRKLLMQ